MKIDFTLLIFPNRSEQGFKTIKQKYMYQKINLTSLFSPHNAQDNTQPNKIAIWNRACHNIFSLT